MSRTGARGSRLPLRHEKYDWGVVWEGTPEQLVEAGAISAEEMQRCLTWERENPVKGPALKSRRPTFKLCSGHSARLSPRGKYRFEILDRYTPEERATQQQCGAPYSMVSTGPFPFRPVEKIPQAADCHPRRRNFPDRTQWTPEQHVAELCRKIRAHYDAGYVRSSDQKPIWSLWRKDLDDYLATLPRDVRERVRAMEEAVDWADDDDD